MSAIQLTTALVAGQPLSGELLSWLKLLVAFDIIFTALALGLVETILVG
jgi:heme exporter protein B